MFACITQILERLGIVDHVDDEDWNAHGDDATGGGPYTVDGSLEAESFNATDKAVGYQVNINSTTVRTILHMGASTDSVYIGSLSGNATAGATQSVGIGNGAMESNTFGTKNIAIGFDALALQTVGDNNVAVGAFALDAVTNTNDNTAVGYRALSGTTGSNGTAIGSGSLAAVTSGSNNTGFGSGVGGTLSTGADNTLIGHECYLFANGSRNVVIGQGAGVAQVDDNVSIGYNAGRFNQGSGNIFIGSGANFAGSVSNKLFIDNAASATPLIYGEFDNDFIAINGDFGVHDGNKVRFYETGSTSYLGFSAPSLAATVNFILPNADGAINEYLQTDGSGNLTWNSPSDTVLTPIPLTSYDAEPARASESNVHGGILSLATAQVISNGVPTGSIAQGIGKIFIVVNAGADLTGTVTITGDTIDRDDPTSITIGDTDTLTLNGSITTDGTSTDTNGNTIHAYNNAFMSSKRFTGNIVLSTTDVNLSDFDVYHCSFEQFNDAATVELDTFDVNLLAVSVNAEFDGYLYSVVNNSGVLAVVNEAALHLGADGVAPVANKYYRLRQSNIAKSLDGSSDGVFADLHYSNTPADIEDVTTKIWGIHSQVIEAGGGAGGGGTTVTFFQVEDDGTTGQLTTGTLADLAGMWASPSLTDGDFSWNGTTGVLTVNTDGILELDVSVTGHNVTVSNHVQIDMSIQIDTGGGYSELIGAHNYAARDFTHDMGTTSVVGFKVIVSAGDLIKVQLKDIGQVFSIGVAAVAAQTYLSAKLYT